MIRPHLSVQHYVTRVTMDPDGCINHCNERNEKVEKNWGHLFSCNDRNKCNKGSFNDKAPSQCPALCNKSNDCLW